MCPPLRLALAAALFAAAAATASAELAGNGDWGRLPAGEARAPVDLRLPSSSPFAPRDIGRETVPPAETRMTYHPAAGASADAPSPAVVLLHGAGGVSAAREGTYARQFAAQGVAVLVVDVFGARPELGGGFIERLLNVTETMALADAFAGLDWLDARPEVDGDRVALIGFSYGAMSTVFAAYEQIAAAFAPAGPRFAAHVAFYGPCIARFAEPATTGAPVLFLWGGRDGIVDPDRCAEIADDLAAGGSETRIVAYPDALHQWDGARTTPWRARRHIADCRLSVDPDGRVWDRTTFLPMAGPLTRRIILAACASEDGYLIGRDDAVRRLSNAELARFLNPVLFPAGAESAGAGAADGRDRL